MNQHSPGGSTAERAIGLGLAAVVVLTFIYMVLWPPPMSGLTLGVVRFLAAMAAALSAYLYTGSLNISGDLPFSRLQVRAGGAFAAFLFVFLAFYWGLDTSEKGSGRRHPLALTHLTTLNDIYLQQLIGRDINREVLETLSIDGKPYLFDASPVHDTIRNMLDSHVKTSLPPDVLRSPDFLVSTGRHTESTTVHARYDRGYSRNSPRREERLETVREDRRSFLEKSAEVVGADRYFDLRLNPFSSDLRQSQWTAFLGGIPGSSRQIVQFPLLSDVLNDGLTPESVQRFRSPLEKKWMQQLLQANPDRRGLFGYQYEYVTSPQDSFLGCGSIPETIHLLAPTTYLRFLDVHNTSDESVLIKSLHFRQSTSSSLHLLESEQLEKELQNVRSRRLSVGLELPAGRHLLIPTEIGFDTSAYRRLLEMAIPDSEAVRLAGEEIFVGRPLDSETVRKAEIRLNSFGESGVDASVIADPVILSPKFLEMAPQLSGLLSRLPTRFALGPVWRVDSLEVARRKISVEDPRLQGPIAFLTATVGVGSCPYLEVQLRGRNDWISLGTVLNGVQGELNQREISYALVSPIQSLRIREREDEVTHLDRFSLSWINEDGRAMEISGPEDALLQQDGRHLILHRGEQYRIDLGNDMLANASDIHLHVSGYYDLLKPQEE